MFIDFLINKSYKRVNHGVHVINIKDISPGLVQDPPSDVQFSFSCEGSTGFDDRCAFRGTCTTDGSDMNYKMVRGNTITRYIREERGADNRFIVEVANICYDYIKNRILMSDLGDNLVEGRTNIKKELDVKVVLITSTYK